MAKKAILPDYGTMVSKGQTYYRTRIKGIDGKYFNLLAKTKEELYQKEKAARKEIEEELFRRANPTVEEYCMKWLEMRSAKVSAGTMKGYRNTMENYIVKPLGDMYLSDVTSDDIQLALIPASKKSASVYNLVNMLIKSMFYTAERNELLDYNPAAKINSKGGTPKKEREALTNDQVKILLDTVKDLPPYAFIMVGVYAGLRREEILALKWDCVFLDTPTPYISVKRAWRNDHNRADISTILKTPAAKRDVPIPKKLVECLKEQKQKSISDFVIADSKGKPLNYGQFQRMWKYVKVRTVGEHSYYKYVNGESIKFTVKKELGQAQKNRPSIVATIDFEVTPHVLRHTYITNLIYMGVDPKTVQYLAGHENSKTTMDIYAKVKYNKPEELVETINLALNQGKDMPK